MKTMDYASSAQSTKKMPTEEYDLVILGGAWINLFVAFLE
jgi:hypothetical protein